MTETGVTDVTSHDLLNAPLEVLDPAIAAVLPRSSRASSRRWR
jgi:hypothetical protein